MSPKFSLSRQDSKKIATGALVAVVGALLTYLTQVVGDIDLGPWTPIVVSVWSIVANIVRKWLVGPDATPTEPPYGGTEAVASA